MRKLIGLVVFASTVMTSGVHAVEILKSETIVGIGATLEKIEDGPVQVMALIPNAPAELSGLLPGDLIHMVKSVPGAEVVDTYNLSLPEVVALIRGPVGVPVELFVTRGESGLGTLTITREAFVVDQDGGAK